MESPETNAPAFPSTLAEVNLSATTSKASSQEASWKDEPDRTMGTERRVRSVDSGSHQRPLWHNCPPSGLLTAAPSTRATLPVRTYAFILQPNGQRGQILSTMSSQSLRRPR